jgi:hypothetical protein
MKKFTILLLAVISAITFSGIAFANQSNTGCGLGSMIFSGKSGLISQTLAITTNNIFGSQTFGITTGTSNCSRFSGIVSNDQINKYVADNMDNLAKDIAKGNGEYLNTFAILLQVTELERAGFNARLQSNFSKIFTSDSVTHTQVLTNIETVLKAS